MNTDQSFSTLFIRKYVYTNETIQTITSLCSYMIEYMLLVAIEYDSHLSHCCYDNDHQIYFLIHPHIANHIWLGS